MRTTPTAAQPSLLDRIEELVWATHDNRRRAAGWEVVRLGRWRRQYRQPQLAAAAIAAARMRAATEAAAAAAANQAGMMHGLAGRPSTRRPGQRGRPVRPARPVQPVPVRPPVRRTSGQPRLGTEEWVA